MGERMNAGEICNREVVFATEEMSIREAAGIMRNEHVGSLVVVREAAAGRIVTGILTDRDIAVVAVARDFDPQSLRVGDVMTADPVTASPDESIHDVLAKMRSRGIRRIPVTTGEGVLVGIITLDDMLEIMAEEMQNFVHAIESGQTRETRIRG